MVIKSTYAYIFVLAVIVCIYGCEQSKELYIEGENRNIVLSGDRKIISSELYILPEGDYRGGGALRYGEKGLYFDARIISNGNEKFFKLLVNCCKQKTSNLKYRFFTKNMSSSLYINENYVTTKTMKVGSRKVKLDKVDDESVIYSVYQNKEKLFTISLPPIENVGYVINVGKAYIGVEADIFYFQTLEMSKVKTKPPVQRAVVAYVLIENIDNQKE